jgi:hypothetical protein
MVEHNPFGGPLLERLVQWGGGGIVLGTIGGGVLGGFAQLINSKIDLLRWAGLGAFYVGLFATAMVFISRLSL